MSQQPDLAAKLAEAEAQAERWKQQYIDEARKSGAWIELQTTLGKVQKTLKIIEHITRDEKMEAIKELLDPLVFVFGVQVKFADDTTMLRAQDEMLETCKQAIRNALDGIKVHRTDEQKFSEVTQKL